MRNDTVERFLSRIVKNQNSSGCWHFLSSDRSKFALRFYVNGDGLRAKRIAFKLFKEKIPKNYSVFSKCNNPLCINPEHQVVGNSKVLLDLLYSRGWKHKSGWKHKPEVIEIIRRTHAGKKIPNELRKRLSLANLGNKHSEETRKKMSKNRIGIAVPEEARKKIAFSKQGRKNYNTRLTPKDIFKIRSLAEDPSGGITKRGKKRKQGKMTIAKIAALFGISTTHVSFIRDRKVWKHI